MASMWFKIVADICDSVIFSISNFIFAHCCITFDALSLPFLLLHCLLVSSVVANAIILSQLLLDRFTHSLTWLLCYFFASAVSPMTCPTTPSLLHITPYCDHSNRFHIHWICMSSSYRFLLYIWQITMFRSLLHKHKTIANARTK